MKLTQQQQHFADLMLGATDAADVFTDSKLSVAAGLDVYRNNLKLAWRNALKATFPVLTQLIGDDGMALLARDYLKQYPSVSGDLNHLGVHLAGFVADYAPLAEYVYLSDVAALEWVMHLAHYAADHTPLSVADLMAHGADEWLAAKVEFAPSAFLLHTQTAAATIWQAHQTDADLQNIAVSQVEYMLVSRPIWRIELLVLAAADYAFLKQLRGGATFEQAFEYLEQHNIEFDFTRALPVLLDAGVWSRIYL